MMVTCLFAESREEQSTSSCRGLLHVTEGDHLCLYYGVKPKLDRVNKVWTGDNYGGGAWAWVGPGTGRVALAEWACVEMAI